MTTDGPTRKPLASYLDAAILKPEATRAEAWQALALCRRYRTRTACVRPCDLTVAHEGLAGSGVGICVVLGFPHGDQLTASKVDEARRYLEAGADEIDMVANFGWVRSGLWTLVESDLTAVAEVTRAAGKVLKVIFETVHLQREEIERMVDLCVGAGAQFVKTSTGFNGAGANEEVVQWMLERARGRIAVKPSGGIRTAEQAWAYIDRGATRLGVGYSAVAALCEGQETVSGY